MFWEKELTEDELKDILRFRRLARYAAVLQSMGLFGLKVPMPKVPPIINELVKLAEESSSTHSGKFDPIALPPEQQDTSPQITFLDSPVVTTIDGIYKTNEDKFEFNNPNKCPNPDITEKPKPNNAELSASQKSAIRDAKVNQLDSSRKQPIHKNRSKAIRAKKRVKDHSILQPWFAILYFLIPLWGLASIYIVPFLRNLFEAWRNQKAIRTAIEIPLILENVLPNTVRSTVIIGVFAVEVTSLVYISIVVISQLMIYFVIRPLIISMSESFSAKGAHDD